MQRINRDFYLNQLVKARGIDLIKVVSGIRRSGKSYLLDPIFKEYLIKDGVPEDHIIHINLELDENSELRDHTKLREYIESKLRDDGEYYLLLDEIQLVEGFEGVLSSFLARKNVDVYVTGSNSKFLSSDIITEFRGRSEDIRMHPLSFAEFYSAREDKDRYAAWAEYLKYGGIPLVLEHGDEASKRNYLNHLRSGIYLRDIVERYNIKNELALQSLIEILASNVGSLTNPYRLEQAFKSKVKMDISYNTINDYISKLEDAFLIEETKRFDVKGKFYIDSPEKYYFADPGIRNSFIGFRQDDEGHMMENIIYNELRLRGFNVDIGVVDVREGDARKQIEVDFVATMGDRKYYIQPALMAYDEEKREQELRPLNNIDDHFSKVIITRDASTSGYDENGILTLGLFDFLLDPDIFNKY